jgi:uncharacterized protein YecE (DUF72 family)
MPFDRDRMKRTLAELARRGVFLGTSSWKYPGWCRMLYDEGRYAWRGKFAERRFNNNCLAEYAEVFKSVCVDAAYYKFPDERYLGGLVSQVPGDFLFAFKVTDEITIKKFANLPRFGPRAGKPNENFLNADLLISAFLAPCEPFRQNIGLLMFEFSKFYPSDFTRGQEFVEALDQFLAKLPKGWPYGIEIRNRHWLREEYFDTLRRHGVAHVFNSWQDMPPVHEQLALPGSRTNPSFCAARFLLRPGRKYEEAVNLFSPYDKLKETNEAGRAAGAKLIQETIHSGGQRKAFIYVNNRFEGNALETIAAMVEGGA